MGVTTVTIRCASCGSDLASNLSPDFESGVENVVEVAVHVCGGG